MKNAVSLTDETAAEVAKIAKLFGVSNDECVERLLTRYVFESIKHEVNPLIAEDVEQTVCQSRARARRWQSVWSCSLLKPERNDPGERPVRASAVRYSDGWGVKAVLRAAA